MQHAVVTRGNSGQIRGCRYRRGTGNDRATGGLGVQAKNDETQREQQSSDQAKAAATSQRPASRGGGFKSTQA